MPGALAHPQPFPGPLTTWPCLSCTEETTRGYRHMQTLEFQKIKWSFIGFGYFFFRIVWFISLILLLLLLLLSVVFCFFSFFKAFIVQPWKNCPSDQLEQPFMLDFSLLPVRTKVFCFSTRTVTSVNYLTTPWGPKQLESFCWPGCQSLPSLLHFDEEKMTDIGSAGKGMGRMGALEPWLLKEFPGNECPMWVHRMVLGLGSPG